MKTDSDGFYRAPSGLKPLDAFTLRNGQTGKLISSVLHNTPMVESKRRVLVYIRDNPDKKHSDCEAAIGISTVFGYYSDFVAIGYVKQIGKVANTAKYRITPTGVTASKRTAIDHESRHKAISEMVGPYEVYSPPKPYYARRGAEDAMKLRSKGGV